MSDKQSGLLLHFRTFVDLLRHRAENKGDELAFTYLIDGEYEETSLTYAELDRRVRALAAQMQAQGLAGHRALLLYPAGLEFVIAYYACLYAGVVAVPAYPPRLNRSLHRIQAIAADADAHVALTTQAVWERVQQLLDQTPDLRTVRWMPTDTIDERQADEWTSPNVDRDDLAFLQYTSGSTGTPKGVMVSHGNLLHNCELISTGFEQSRRGVGVFWLPSYHDMGLVGGILQPVYFGRPNVLMSPVAFLQRPIRWLQAISRFHGTVSGGPNFAYDLCVRKTTPEQRAGLDLSRWNLAFNGAEPVRAETLERFYETFAPYGFRREAFYPCFGLAEATLIVSGGYRDDPPVVRAFDSRAMENGEVAPADESDGDARLLVGSGQALPGHEIAIVDPETLTRCAAGRVGEVWAKGPSIAQGYLNRPEETQTTFNGRLADTGEGPFLRTGDLGFLDHGELFIAGRIKDLIIVRGLNHYPHDIELTVEQSHAGVRPGCGAAFTVEDGDEQRLVLVYEIERTHRRDAQPIFEAICRDVSREHELLVDTIALVKAGSIPKTSSGKIQRHACRRAFVEGALDIVAQWNAGDSASVPATKKTTAKADRSAARRATAAVESLAGLIDDERVASAAARFDEVNQNGAERSLANDTGAPSLSKAEHVLEEVRKVAKGRAAGLTLDSSIVELGLDSLERMEILASLEERLGGRFPEDVIVTLETCRDVLAAAEKYLGSGRSAQGRMETLEIPTEHYHFDQFPEYQRLQQNLGLIDIAGLENPFFSVHQQVATDTTVIEGRELINYSSFNYLGMSGDPTVAQAAKDAIDQYGTSVSASRLVSGEKSLHRELERAICDLVGAEDAITFVSGHQTNETTIGHLFGPGDLILHDSLAHNSIVQGSVLSGARRRAFAHNDWRAVDRLLTEMRGEYRRVLIAIEGVYSMDGDMPDLPRFIEVKKRHKALLMIDEAHSIGVLGPHGRGIGEHFDVDTSDVDLWMGTISKAFGSCGGYIAGCREVIRYLKYTAPSFVFAVGISPSNCAAGLAAIRLLEDEPERVERLRENGRLFLSLAKQRGMNTGTSKDSPVVPIILGNSFHCLQVSRAMAKRGVNVMPILHPAVEERASRLRFFITSNHSEEQIRYTVDVLTEELAKVNPAYVATTGRNGHMHHKQAVHQ